MNFRIVGAFAAVALLVACTATPPTPAPTAAPMAPPMASGPAPGSQEDLVATAGDRVYFDTDRSTLSTEAQDTLGKQAAWLAKYGQVAVQVAGNCDERGTEEYNIALGQRRANAARDYLVAKGVAGSRITTISYGKDRPIDPASTPEAWAQNRNATTSVQ
jgi:peptidoglycan-associated lipoprotein